MRQPYFWELYRRMEMPERYASCLSVTHSSSPECSVVICHDKLEVLNDLHVVQLRQHASFWRQYPQARFTVEWKQGSNEKTVVAVFVIGKDHETDAQFDALRREAYARRNYRSPRDLDSRLLGAPQNLLESQEIRHTSERKEVLWVVGGNKGYFTEEAAAVDAARTAFNAWLLRYGISYAYSNAFAAEAREALAAVWPELPADFHKDLRTTVEYMALRMNEEVAARIRTRGQTPQEYGRRY